MWYFAWGLILQMDRALEIETRNAVAQNIPSVTYTVSPSIQDAFMMSASSACRHTTVRLTVMYVDAEPPVPSCCTDITFIEVEAMSRMFWKQYAGITSFAHHSGNEHRSSIGGYMKFWIPLLSTQTRTIVVDADTLWYKSPRLVWALFDEFNDEQAIGYDRLHGMNFTKRVNSGLLLLRIDRLRDRWVPAVRSTMAVDTQCDTTPWVSQWKTQRYCLKV